MSDAQVEMYKNMMTPEMLNSIPNMNMPSSGL